jgi:hypothetical protein
MAYRLCQEAKLVIVEQAEGKIEDYNLPLGPENLDALIFKDQIDRNTPDGHRDSIPWTCPGDDPNKWAEPAVSHMRTSWGGKLCTTATLFVGCDLPTGSVDYYSGKTTGKVTLAEILGVLCNHRASDIVAEEQREDPYFQASSDASS